MELIAEKYVGYEEFNKQVLEDAPYYIQQAFDDYNIPAKVVAGSCSWWHPREDNFADECINFDLEINTDWVAKTFMELSKDEDFIEFIKSKYTSRSGFISFMPNSIEGFNEYISPDDHEYWKVVSAIVSYLVDIDPSVKEDVMDEMYEDLRGSGNFVTYSDLNMN